MDRGTALQIISDLEQAYDHYSGAGNPVPTVGWELTHILYADDLPGIDSHFQAYGFIARNENAHRVILRGTADITEAFDDAGVLLTAWAGGGGGKVHKGISSIYKTLIAAPFATPNPPVIEPTPEQKQPLLDYLRGLEEASNEASKKFSITIGGHSLGAAMATMLACELNDNAAEVYTFGSPQTGDPDFAANYNAKVPNTWRYAHQDDPVPRLPDAALDLIEGELSAWLTVLIKGVAGQYAHVNTLKSVGGGFGDILEVILKHDPIYFHHLSTYAATI